MASQSYNKQYYAKHRKKLLAQQKEYYYANKDIIQKRSKISKRKYRLVNKDKIALWNKKYYQRHKEEYYKRHLSHRYGVTPEEYIKIRDKSKGKCGICGKRFTNRKRSRVDHCHSSGKIRGLLCHSCNIHLDWFIKNEKGARDYLEKT